MKKKILIISNPGKIGDENYCEGVNRDVDNYINFFTSSGGGSWYSTEIECLKQPDITTVKKTLDNMKDLDFSIIIFTGHGYSNNEKTYIELKPADNTLNDLCVDNLRINDKKRIIIVDCCRKECNLLSNMNESFAEIIEKSNSSRVDTRALYEGYIRNADNMNIIMYSCDWGETSGDDSRKGGYYTSSLLKICKEYLEQNNRALSSGYLSAVEAHEKAKPYVKKLKNDQNPQIEKPRSGEYLPFAVVK